MLRSMSPNASVVVHPCIRELVALCRSGSWFFCCWVFLGCFLKILSSAVSRD